MAERFKAAVYKIRRQKAAFLQVSEANAAKSTQATLVGAVLQVFC
jgi:hypothetical protein